MVSWFLSFLASWFVGFLVSWCFGFLVSRIFGFLASKFESFLVSKFQRFNEFPFHVFLDLDPVSNIFKGLLDGSAGLCGAHLFEDCQKYGVPQFEIYRNTTCLIFQGFS